MTKRILYLEDEPDVVTLVRLILSQSGCEVIGASSVPAARKILKSTEIDLFLIDIMMPGENGWDFLDFLADRQQFDQTPKIVLTAKVPAPDPKTGKHALESDERLATFLIKPFSPKNLMEAVLSHL
ncbi:MAG: response regulator [Caldilineaceae bacterium]|nr:response regulator [Caldilineaceae bacterium]MBP8106679.1 response regulator [Caldilineaceae bacterium]MBP8122181.1 response regulator [Caldilineaceae bacterium]MBP9071730.1 response regulator [Caldilineaceae bacterium]